MRKWWPLILITLLAGVLRFWDLTGTPPSPNWDEVSHGYNAYSILKTGMDEWGVRFPLIFKAFGDYKLPIYIYLTSISVSLFGLNTFAIRFVSALAGTLAIPGIYLLASALFPQKNPNKNNNDFVIPRSVIAKHVVLWQSHFQSVPLLSALFLALSPWHFFISRPALEANLALTFIIFGFYFLLKFFTSVIASFGTPNRSNPENVSQHSTFYTSLLPAAIFLGLSLHAYNTARIFVPLLIILTIIIFKKEVILLFHHSGLDPESIKINTILIKNILAILIFSFSVFLVGSQIFSGEGTARYSKLQILSENAIFQIGEKRATSALPPVVSKFIHNRPIFFITSVAKNYISYFTPQFLYQSKGAQTQFAIPGQNLFTWPVILLACIGLILSGLSLSQKGTLFLLSWLLLSPVAASLTADPPQAIRPNPLIPAVIILAAFGANFLLGESKKFGKILALTIFGLVVFTFSQYLYVYFHSYSSNYSTSWQYGYQDIVEYTVKNAKSYDKIFITKAAGEPHIFYAFFAKLDPQIIQPGGDNIRYSKSDWFWTDRIGNIYFINDWDIPDSTEAKVLHLESGADIPTNNSLLITTNLRIPTNATTLETISHPNNYPAFVITKIP